MVRIDKFLYFRSTPLFMVEITVGTLYQQRMVQAREVLDELSEQVDLELDNKYKHNSPFPAIRYTFEGVDGNNIEGYYLDFLDMDELDIEGMGVEELLQIYQNYSGRAKTGFLDILVSKHFVLGLTDDAFQGMIATNLATYYVLNGKDYSEMNAFDQASIDSFVIDKFEVDIVQFRVEQFFIEHNDQPPSMQFYKYFAELKKQCPEHADQLLQRVFMPEVKPALSKLIVEIE
ncbi:hypothetical protein HOK51_00210 [Candidatus Woesearchaeota archaeon]|jgi:hypothetical protein|nr:hypothetical protein [Candidatus Woesearchaeota archaeon]MBT7367464.1 hypothetical protein [Candidatus Woesearchaeota archaeon]